MGGFERRSCRHGKEQVRMQDPAGVKNRPYPIGADDGTEHTGRRREGDHHGRHSQEVGRKAKQIAEKVDETTAPFQHALNQSHRFEP